MKFIVTILSFLIVTPIYSQTLNESFNFKDTFKTSKIDLYSGIYKDSYPNGTTRIHGKFQNGMLDGFLYFYNHKGKLTRSILQSNDTTHVASYNKKSQMIVDTLLKKGNVFEIKEYFEGKINSIQKISRYSNGLLNGRTHTFFENKSKSLPSAIAVETVYLNGLKHGIESYYTPSGLCKVATCYSSDSFCYRIFYDKTGKRKSIEVNTGNKKPKDKEIPEPICKCDVLNWKE
jgi:antitoxin component YwqK of YwqJK toxin-antitoxin module